MTVDDNVTFLTHLMWLTDTAAFYEHNLYFKPPCTYQLRWNNPHWQSMQHRMVVSPHLTVNHTHAKCTHHNDTSCKAQWLEVDKYLGVVDTRNYQLYNQQSRNSQTFNKKLSQQHHIFHKTSSSNIRLHRTTKFSAKCIEWRLNWKEHSLQKVKPN